MRRVFRKRRPARRLLPWAGGAILLAVAAWFAGFAVFAARLPARAPAAGKPTDGIVVLTGGERRVDTGLRLLARGRGKRLLISGVHRDVDLTALLRANGRNGEAVPSCCITLGHDARTTRGNAAETAAWAAAHGYTSLRLVTAAYHMPRSLMIFRRRMPEMRIEPHPVVPARLRAHPWWRSPRTARVLMVEYSKYLAALARDTLLARLWGTAP